MHSRVICFVFLALLVCSVVVSANEVAIMVKTHNPDHGTLIRILDWKTKSVIDSITTKTNLSGDANATYQTSRAEIAFLVMLIKNGEIVEKKDFDGKETTKPIVLWFYEAPKEQPAPVNTTNATTPDAANLTTNTTISNQTALTGNASTISFSLKTIPVWVYYTILSVLVVAAGVFVFNRYGETMLDSIKGISFGSSPVKTRGMSHEESASSLKRKLLAAQGELKEIKKEQQVKEAKARVEKAREELRRIQNDKW